jgi:hypothetical protein
MLHRVPGFNTWHDEQTPLTGVPVDAAISNGIDGSATLLVILSRAYLGSVYCERVAALLKCHQAQPDILARTFVVERDQDARDRCPDVFLGLRTKYYFWDYYKDSDGRVVERTLGTPLPNSHSSDPYGRWLDLLTSELANKLNEWQRPWTGPGGASTDRAR